MRVNHDHGNQTVTASPKRSVYGTDGADRLGAIQEQGNKFFAFDRQGRPLDGTFNSLAEASVAVWRAAHNQRSVP
jgi:hypothetical protein